MAEVWFKFEAENDGFRWKLYIQKEGCVADGWRSTMSEAIKSATLTFEAWANGIGANYG